MPYYLGAFVGLGILHYIQSELPFLAKDLAQLADGKEINFSYWILVWFAVGIIVFRTSSRLLFFYPARMMQRDVRVELVKRLETTLPIRYSRHFDSGQIFQIVGNDIDAIRGLVGFGLLQIGNIVIAMAVLIPKLVNFEWRLVYALSPLFIAFGLFTIIVARNRKYYRKTQDLQGQINQFIVESYQGKETIQNYQNEVMFSKLFKKTSFAELFNFYQAGKGIAFSIPLVPFGLGISLLWGALIIKQLDMGTSSLVLFSGFIFLFLEPLMFLSWIGVVFARSIVSWNRFKELINLIATPDNLEIFLNEKNYYSEKDEYRINYWEEETSIRIPEGSWTGIISATGDGKSEVIKQITTIAKSKGHAVSYVAQSPYLYNDSVANNLFLGQEEKDRDLELAKKLLSLFELEILHSDLNELLKMEVGENGKRLSGGQAKRICLIRSLLSGADYLLWDDPFSSVDLLLERKIMDELKSLGVLNSRTIILTTHRLSTLKFCEKYILIKKNHGISEEGIVGDSIKESDKLIYEHFKDQLTENLSI